MMNEVTIKERLSLIERDIKYIKGFIETDRRRMQDHVDTSEDFRAKVIKLSRIEEAFKEHCVSDRWLFGIIISLQLVILTKLFI